MLGFFTQLSNVSAIHTHSRPHSRQSLSMHNEAEDEKMSELPPDDQAMRNIRFPGTNPTITGFNDSPSSPSSPGPSSPNSVYEQKQELPPPMNKRFYTVRFFALCIMTNQYSRFIVLT